MMNNAQMTRAILTLRPDAEFSLSGTDLDHIQWLSDGEPPSLSEIEAKWDEIKDIPEPISLRALTARQIRLGLIAMGQPLSAVTDAISQLEEPAKSQALIEWEYASEYRRDHPLIDQIAAALELSSEEIDQFWSQAQDL